MSAPPQKKSNRQIFKGPEKMVVLKMNRRVLGERRERLVVEYPLERGPQACLIELISGSTKRERMDAVIDLPRKGILTGIPFSCPLYSAALGLIKTAYSREIGDKLSDAYYMATIVRNGPYILPEELKLRDELKMAIATLPPLGNSAAGDAMTSVFIQQSLWIPTFLFMNEVRKKEHLLERWGIIQQWDAWEREALSWVERWKRLYPDRTPRDLAQESRRLFDCCKNMGLQKNYGAV
jgi:hypothetical protein